MLVGNGGRPVRVTDLPLGKPSCRSVAPAPRYLSRQKDTHTHTNTYCRLTPDNTHTAVCHLANKAAIQLHCFCRIIIKDCGPGILLLNFKLTSDRHEGSRGLRAAAELLVCTQTKFIGKAGLIVRHRHNYWISVTYSVGLQTTSSDSARKPTVMCDLLSMVSCWSVLFQRTAGQQTRRQLRLIQPRAISPKTCRWHLTVLSNEMGSSTDSNCSQVYTPRCTCVAPRQRAPSASTHLYGAIGLHTSH